MDSINKVIAEIKKHNRDANAPRGLFPASAADRWLACPKSSYLSKDIPPDTSVYAEEGKLAHRVCEALYYKKMYEMPFPEDLSKEMKSLDDGGQEMMDCAKKYVGIIGCITNNKKELGEIKYVGVEKYLYADEVRDQTRVAGLADYLVIGTKGAVIVDFKYGKGHAVDASHPQLLTYLTALKDIDVPYYTFVACVYQPRVDNDNGGLSNHFYTRDDLLAHYKEIQRVRKEYESADTQLNYGSHCRWCPAKRTKEVSMKCPIVDKKQVDKMWDNVMEATMAMEQAKARTGLDRDEKIKDFFTILPELLEYKTIFEAELLKRLESGEDIKGFKITERPGRRKWAGTPEETGAQLERLFPNELGGNYGATVEKMRTITEIEKRIGKGKLDKFTEVGKAKKQLVVTDEVDIDSILARVEEEV